MPAAKTQDQSVSWRETKATLLAQLQARRTELEPIIAELEDIDGQIALLDPEARPSGRRFSTARRGPRGNHDDQFISILTEHPGLKVSEVAKQYPEKGFGDVAKQYLYKVADRNLTRGYVSKDSEGRYFVTMTEAVTQETPESPEVQETETADA